MVSVSRCIDGRLSRHVQLHGHVKAVSPGVLVLLCTSTGAAGRRRRGGHGDVDGLLGRLVVVRVGVTLAVLEEGLAEGGQLFLVACEHSAVEKAVWHLVHVLVLSHSVVVHLYLMLSAEEVQQYYPLLLDDAAPHFQLRSLLGLLE